MRGHGGAIASRIGNSEDEPHAPPAQLGECRAFQLASSKLRLEIEQRSLDLQRNDLIGALQNHVGGATIRGRRDRHFKPDVPPAMAGLPDDGGHAELP